MMTDTPTICDGCEQVPATETRTEGGSTPVYRLCASCASTFDASTSTDPCPECGTDLRFGGNPDCEVCAGEPVDLSSIPDFTEEPDDNAVPFHAYFPGAVNGECLVCGRTKDVTIGVLGVYRLHPDLTD